MKIRLMWAYGKEVWRNKKMDELRKKECLCMNCGHIKDCGWASELYGMCKDHNLALAVTRCPKWEGK